MLSQAEIIARLKILKVQKESIEDEIDIVNADIADLEVDRNLMLDGQVTEYERLVVVLAELETLEIDTRMVAEQVRLIQIDVDAAENDLALTLTGNPPENIINQAAENGVSPEVQAQTNLDRLESALSDARGGRHMSPYWDTAVDTVLATSRDLEDERDALLSLFPPGIINTVSGIQSQIDTLSERL